MGVFTTPPDENGGGFPGLECDGADGTRNDHDGRDVRDVNISAVVFVVVVALVPGTRRTTVICGQRTSDELSIF